MYSSVITSLKIALVECVHNEEPYAFVGPFATLKVILKSHAIN